MSVLGARGCECALVCFRMEKSVFKILKTTYIHARNGLTEMDWVTKMLIFSIVAEVFIKQGIRADNQK